MAMRFPRLDFLYITAFLVMIHLHLLPPASSAEESPRSAVPMAAASAPRGEFSEEKSRLGSTPPSCHNRCNDCNPCIAVQVPTLPSHDSVDLGVGGETAIDVSPSSVAKKYTNYKPLGWKCRCRNRLFVP
ncbi:hypothetical protein H6P81_011422 [Aristolochia fimbriata]|uniref:Epidermal patterning factor-like protein n=1 Tax=Aristolochia fimbriata TaxID=158543 RepID=A0AAV7EUZ4_ARIFI|nr:hypothetical protein H6P81_011422 [Aristolochia fimbriata]